MHFLRKGLFRKTALSAHTVTLAALTIAATPGCADTLGLEETTLAVTHNESETMLHPLYWFFPAPVVEDIHLPVFGGTHEQWSGQDGMRPASATVEGRGDLFFSFSDCAGANVAGLTVSASTADELSARFFFQEGLFLLDPNGTDETDGRGAMGIFGLQSDSNITVTVSHRASGIVVGDVRLFVAADANSTLFMTPNTPLTQEQVAEIGVGDFSCSLPQGSIPSTSNPDAGVGDSAADAGDKTIEVGLDFVDTNGNALTDITVKACPSVGDRTCSGPDATQKSDSEGEMTLELSTATSGEFDDRLGFKGYLKITGSVPQVP